MRRALLLALLLAGCAAVERAPPASSAEAPLPAAFALLDRERPATGAIAGLLPRGDRGFAELERRALADAPTLAAAVARGLIANWTTAPTPPRTSHPSHIHSCPVGGRSG